MLFEIQNASANASAFLFQTTFLHLGGYSATNTITRALLTKETSYCMLKGLGDMVIHSHILVLNGSKQNTFSAKYTKVKWRLS